MRTGTCSAVNDGPRIFLAVHRAIGRFVIGDRLQRTSILWWLRLEARMVERPARRVAQNLASVYTDRPLPAA